MITENLVREASRIQEYIADLTGTIPVLIGGAGVKAYASQRGLEREISTDYDLLVPRNDIPVIVRGLLCDLAKSNKAHELGEWYYKTLAVFRTRPYSLNEFNIPFDLIAYHEDTDGNGSVFRDQAEGVFKLFRSFDLVIHGEFPIPTEVIDVNGTKVYSNYDALINTKIHSNRRKDRADLELLQEKRRKLTKLPSKMPQ